ncbi:MAG: hypothetical protein OEU92_04200 [Alphaproteobacteria bacterium]|nr:hypothetical protein [Alphaproteobacteria bacterium]
MPKSTAAAAMGIARSTIDRNMYKWAVRAEIERLQAKATLRDQQLIEGAKLEVAQAGRQMVRRLRQMKKPKEDEAAKQRRREKVRLRAARQQAEAKAAKAEAAALQRATDELLRGRPTFQEAKADKGATQTEDERMARRLRQMGRSKGAKAKAGAAAGQRDHGEFDREFDNACREDFGEPGFVVKGVVDLLDGNVPAVFIAEKLDMPVATVDAIKAAFDGPQSMPGPPT